MAGPHVVLPLLQFELVLSDVLDRVIGTGPVLNVTKNTIVQIVTQNGQKTYKLAVFKSKLKTWLFKEAFDSI